ncbi:tripartite tricarboxylate transporter substrate binding protein [Cupriavidus basilensis]
MLARLVVAGLANSLGQPVIVENRPGANGVIGANVVYAALPDGCTLLFAAADFISVAPHIHKKVVQFQPNGFRPIAPVAKMGFVLAGRPDADTKTVQDIVAKAKTNALTYGHWGPGSMAQMGMELLKSKAHIDNMLEVPFGGAAPAMTAVMGGQVDYAFIPTPLAVANRTKLRLYALRLAGAFRFNQGGTHTDRERLCRRCRHLVRRARPQTRRSRSSMQSKHKSCG